MACPRGLGSVPLSVAQSTRSVASCSASSSASPLAPPCASVSAASRAAACCVSSCVCPPSAWPALALAAAPMRASSWSCSQGDVSSGLEIQAEASSAPACRIPRSLLCAASSSGSSEDAKPGRRRTMALSPAAAADTSGGEGSLSRDRSRASSGGSGRASTACGATAQQRISAPTALTRTLPEAVGASSRLSDSGAASSARRLSASLVSKVSAGQARSDSGEPRSRCIVFCSSGISSCDGESSSAHAVYPTCLARGLGCCARPIAGMMANGAGAPNISQ